MFGKSKAKEYAEEQYGSLTEAVCDIEKKLEFKIACLSELCRRLEERLNKLEEKE